MLRYYNNMYINSQLHSAWLAIINRNTKTNANRLVMTQVMMMIIKVSEYNNII